MKTLKEQMSATKTKEERQEILGPERWPVFKSGMLKLQRNNLDVSLLTIEERDLLVEIGVIDKFVNGVKQ